MMSKLKPEIDRKGISLWKKRPKPLRARETTVGLTMNYNPFSFISCQEDALVLAGCISHGLDADVIKKSGDLFATARAMLLDACVACSIARAAIR